MKTIANVLGVARSHLHERVHRPTAARGSYCKAADEELLPLIRRLVDERPTYGYRRVTALVNRVLAAEGQPAEIQAPHAVEWLSDNGSPFTAKETLDFAAGEFHAIDVVCDRAVLRGGKINPAISFVHAV